MTLGLNRQNKIEILTDTIQAGTTSKWAQIGAGFKNIATAMNEAIYQANYLNGSGFGSTEVTGAQFFVTLTGDRVFGDGAQDYIFDPIHQFELGDSRKTQFKITTANEEVIIGNCTLVNINITGGDANTASAVSVVIHFDGQPTIYSSSTASVPIIKPANNPLKQDGSAYTE